MAVSSPFLDSASRLGKFKINDSRYFLCWTSPSVCNAPSKAVPRMNNRDDLERKARSIRLVTVSPTYSDIPHRPLRKPSIARKSGYILQTYRALRSTVRYLPDRSIAEVAFRNG